MWFGVLHVARDRRLLQSLFAAIIVVVGISACGGGVTGNPTLVSPPGGGGGSSGGTTPGPIFINPTSVAICPTSGPDKCATNTDSVTITQIGFSGNILESDTCPTDVATLTSTSASGPISIYNISGVSATGSCRATFTGGGGQKVAVAIIVTAPGVGLDIQPITTPNE